MTSRFVQALADGEAVEVCMNKVEFVSFVGSGKKSIGTRDLNSCTAVTLASSQGAIMAHISPLPNPTTDPQASIRHTQKMMADFLRVYHQRKRDFQFMQRTKSPVVVYALFLGQVALPTQRDSIHDIFSENLEDDQFPREYSYNVSVGGHTDPAKGTVFVDGRSGRPKLYVADAEKELL